MALNPFRASLRAAVNDVVASASTSGPSRFFSSSAVTCESTQRAAARRKRTKVLALRASTAAQIKADAGHPILGSPPAGPSSSGPSSLYEQCRLAKVVLRANDIWYSAPPNYAAGGQPEHYLPGLSEADKELLFGALPHASAQLAFDPSRPAASAAAAADQAQQTEAMRRILDLRHASKAGIEVVNRQRIISEFGRNKPGSDKGVDTGSSEVQAALLTHKIRELAAHIDNNPRDIHNKRRLRILVHKRARVLQYFKRENEAHYDQLLADIGLCRSAVEGEIKVGM